ncbi:MAG: Gfo/Idh/MocA family oxidoreductase [Bacteroidetes bacterium]|nr:Gfo/Idh/MocA family oxidoreductase [Bacteroidota bacterium]
MSKLDRRDFLKSAALAGAGAAIIGLPIASCKEETEKKLSTKPSLPKVAPLKKVRIGFVGVGNQGSWHVQNFLKMDNVELVAICDIIPEKVERVQKWVTDAGLAKPKGYSAGPNDYVRMCEKEDLDLVYTATPWKWHVPICVAAMKNGKHAATEVPAALTIEECWKLVETAEKYNKHCVMMENCNYGRRELMVLNMVRKGIFGEIINGTCGYLHDLRNYKLGDEYEGNWRIEHSIKRNGNLYPTHGLGPVANCMNINRGDRFDYLVSMSSNSRGLQMFANEHLGPDHEYSKTKYALGDVNISLIKTVKGLTITLIHDTNLPRPYDRIDMVQGTHAISIGYPDRIHIEGKSPAHQWEPMENYRDQFDHDLWKNIGDLAKDANHGGMDFLEDYRLVQALLNGTPTDMDVYDAVTLSVPSELSEISVANRSKPVDFPDFTRGFWKEREPLIIPGA